ncbi:MAG: hypothetical protein ACFFD4_29340 [Candidatus Odinarchaeota archaeon]
MESSRNYLFSRYFWLPLVISLVIFAVVLTFKLFMRAYPLFPASVSFLVFVLLYPTGEQQSTAFTGSFDASDCNSGDLETAMAKVLARFLQHSKNSPGKQVYLMEPAKQESLITVSGACEALEGLGMLVKVRLKGKNYYSLHRAVLLLARFVKTPASWFTVGELVKSEDDWLALHELGKKQLVSDGVLHGKPVLFLAKNPHVPDWTYYTGKALAVLVKQEEGTEP